VTVLLSAEPIENLILLLRGYKVILDTDLADLYQVQVKQLKRQVRRNRDRFPADFMFELSKQEYESLRRQTGTLKRGAHSKYLPYAFTEQGAAMLSSVLNSKRAVQVNIQIMRAFVKLRQLLASDAQLTRKLDAMEKKYDAQFKVVFDAIRRLMTLPRRLLSNSPPRPGLVPGVFVLTWRLKHNLFPGSYRMPHDASLY
jgi:hypothetical protein